jgi:hypothetical protein
MLSVMLSAVLASLPLSATALVEWTFNTTNCQSTSGPSGSCGSGSGNLSDSRTYGTSAGTGPDVTVTGWGNTANGNSQLEQGEITHYGSSNGLGVRNADGPRGSDVNENNPPEHSVDNEERFDFVLFDFNGTDISLSEASLGWFQNDADITVLVYEGNQDVLDTSAAHYIGDRELTASTEDLTSNGWSLVGNFDVDANDGSAPYTQSLNTTASSSYWLIGAYASAFGSGCTPSGYCQTSYVDYAKILGLAGTTGGGSNNGVPAPSTLLLMGLGLLVMRRRLPRATA